MKSIKLQFNVSAFSIKTKICLFLKKVENTPKTLFKTALSFVNKKSRVFNGINVAGYVNVNVMLCLLEFLFFFF